MAIDENNSARQAVRSSNKKTVSFDSLLQKFSRTNLIDCLNSVQTTKVGLLVCLIFSLTQQLRLIYRSGATVNTLHSYFYSDFIKLISADSLNIFRSSPPMIAVTTFSVVNRVVVFLYLIHKYRRDILEQRFPNSIARLLGFSSAISVAAITVMKIEMAILAFQIEPKYWIFFGFLLLIFHSVDLCLLLVFSKDYRYVKLNRFQGISYAYFGYRMLGLILLSMIRFAAGDTKNYGARVFINLLNIGFAVGLIVYQTVTLNFYTLGFFQSMFPLVDCIYLWESFIGLINTMDLEFSTAANLDFISFLTIPLMLAVLKSFWLFIADRLLMRNLDSITKGREAKVYMQLLYDCRLQNKDPRKTFQLYSTLAHHSKTCRNTFCLCFQLNVRFEKEKLGYHQSFEILNSDSDMNLKRNKGDVKLNMIFGREDQGHRHFSNTGPAQPNSYGRFRTFSSRSRLPQEISTKPCYYLNLRNGQTLNSVFCSFFVKLRSQIEHGVLELFIEQTTFLVYELQNYMAAILSLYLFRKSEVYSKISNFYTEYVINRLIALAKRRLGESVENRDSSALNRVSFSKVLYYKNRLDAVNADISKVMSIKLKYYQELAKKEVNFEKVTSIGYDLNNKVIEIKTELSRLSSISTKNENLVRLMISFDILVMETPFMSKRSTTILGEFQQEQLNKAEGPSSKSNCITRLSLYGASTAAVFSNCLDENLKVSKYTSNAPKLFGTPEKEFKGSPIKNYMPKIIANVHDSLVSNYLNGYTTSSDRGCLETVMKTGGKL